MASVNKCLKWIFIVFNALFVLTGAGIVVRVNVSRTMAMKEGYWNFWPASLFGGLIAGISFVGACGAYRERRRLLILFSVLVSIGMVICLMGLFSPLAQIICDAVSTYIQQFQEEYNLTECCGYQDWGSQIPESCICPEPYWGTLKCYKYFHAETYTEVYSEPCLPFSVEEYVIMDGNGILFGLAIVALIGVIMAVTMTCQIKKQRTAVPVPTYECSQPPAYDELFPMKSMPERI